MSNSLQRVSELLSGLRSRPHDAALLNEAHEQIDDLGADFYRAVIQEFGIVTGARGAAALERAAAGAEGVTRQTWRNSTANQVAQPLRYFKPASLEELRSVVRQAAASRCKIKAIGSGHSFSDVALTTDFMVDTHALNRTLALEQALLKNTVDSRHLFKSECGILIRDLNTSLDREGLALLNMGGWDGQTIAGAVSTSTHGSGISLGSLSSAVRSLVLLTADDRLIQVEPAGGITDPAKFAAAHPEIELKQDDDWFHSVAVSMGCMGIVYSLTLEVRDKYWLEETRQLGTWDQVKRDLEDGGVLTANRHYEVLVNPYLVNGRRTCLVTIRNETPAHSSANPFKERKVFADLVSRLPGATEALLFLFDHFPQLTPKIIDDAMNQLVDQGYVNVSYDVLNLGGANSINAYSSEIGFPMTTYLQAVDKLLELAEHNRTVGNVYHTSPFSLRFVKQSSDYLSMQFGENTCMIEIPMINGTIGGNEILKKYETAMYQFGGRPHWGQMNYVTGSHNLIQSMYPMLGRWLAVYNQLNANGTFDNNFTDRCGFSTNRFGDV